MACAACWTESASPSPIASRNAGSRRSRSSRHSSTSAPSTVGAKCRRSSSRRAAAITCKPWVPGKSGARDGSPALGKPRGTVAIIVTGSAAGVARPGQACRPIAASRSSSVVGFVTSPFMPAARHCAISSTEVVAVSAMIGTAPGAPDRMRICRAVSLPLSPGICTSISTTSYGRRDTAAIAASPEAAVSTRWPARRSRRAITMRLAATSSTSSMRVWGSTGSTVCGRSVGTTASGGSVSIGSDIQNSLPVRRS